MFLSESYIDPLLNFIFPRTCYLCGLNSQFICKKCRKNLGLNWLHRCHVCGKESRLNFVHSECRESSYLDGLIYVVLYDGKVTNIIKDVKYSFYYAVFNEVGKIMADYLSRYKLENVIITSVPLHWQRKNYRGFNQSDLLAKNISKNSNYKYIELLKRRSNTKKQATLGRDGRLENLKGAFALKEDWNLKDLNIIIVDDVFTTGSTLSECAKALKLAGARNVYGFCFAKSQE